MIIALGVLGLSTPSYVVPDFQSDSLAYRVMHVDKIHEFYLHEGNLLSYGRLLMFSLVSFPTIHQSLKAYQLNIATHKKQLKN